jgi:Tfp pilus assembly protein PilN
MIEINLVPDVKQELIRAQRVRSTVISVAILTGLVAGAVIVLLVLYVGGVQTLRGTIADAAISDNSKKLAAVEDLSKTLTIQNQLTKISSLHDSVKVDSRVFDVLLAIIPPAPNTVFISNLLVDASTDTITMEGQAPNSYAAVEVFRKTIEGAKVSFKKDGTTSEVALASNVSTSDTSYGEDSSGARVLRFTLSFTYAKELLSTQSSDISITNSNSGNVTDSFIGVPTSIFVDRATDITGGQ